MTSVFSGPANPGSTVRSEYIRALERIRQMLSERANTRFLVIGHREAIGNPLQIAGRGSQFMEYDLDVAGYLPGR